VDVCGAAAGFGAGVVAHAAENTSIVAAIRFIDQPFATLRRR
jgi:hypothetical protein